jgi:uncharacterized iron-regulated protein
MKTRHHTLTGALGRSRVQPRALLLTLAVAWMLPAAGRSQSVTSGAIAGAPDSSFRVYDSQGSPSSLQTIVAASATVEVVLLGESHNDRVGHALQLELFKQVLASGGLDPDASIDAARPPGARPVTLSLEMFERDVQYVLEEYLTGHVREDLFLESARPWRHYETDYRPLVEIARTLGLTVVAANAPRRYVNRVTREGPESLVELSATARSFLPPLPYGAPSEAYRAAFDAAMRPAPDTSATPVAAAADSTDSRGPGPFGIWAQTLWDAGMAHSIAGSLMARPAALVVHLVGSFHVRNGWGLPEHLARYRPGTRKLVVFVSPVPDPSVFSDSLTGAGDFVILTDSHLARSTEEQMGS